jgi:hypothetical protein
MELARTAVGEDRSEELLRGPHGRSNNTCKYFAGWLSKHAVIASSLELPHEWQDYSSSWQRAAAAEIAAGLQAAAAAAADTAAAAAEVAAAQPNGLMLQSFKAYSIEAPILAQLPPQHLTALSLSHNSKLDNAAAVNAALLRLTKLQTLDLYHASRPSSGSAHEDGFMILGIPLWAMRPWETENDICWCVNGLLPGLTAMQQLTR